MSSAERPLRGRVILLTRPADRAEGLARRLGELGARVDRRPTVALVPPTDGRPARQATAQIAQYDWILFTSANGVRSFCEVMEEIHGELPPLSAKLGAIGSSTARAMDERGLRADTVARTSRSEGLAHALEGRIASGQRVLLVRPEAARELLSDTIRAAGAEVHAVPFYRNVPAPGVDQVAHDLCDDRYDIVVFTSPSTCERLLELVDPPADTVREALRRAALVAIGEVTARAMETSGSPPDAIAAEASEHGIVDAVLALSAD